MKIKLNEEQSKILISIALKDLLPKEMEKLKKQRGSCCENTKGLQSE